MLHESLSIAIDFDGTIVEDEYPRIGKPRVYAFETLKALEQKGHRLILWTYRSGRELEEAVEFCRKNGVEFYAINKEYPEDKFSEKGPRKINADVFIDDRNLGGVPEWGEIYALLMEEMPQKPKKKKGIFGFRK